VDPFKGETGGRGKAIRLGSDRTGKQQGQEHQFQSKNPGVHGEWEQGGESGVLPSERGGDFTGTGSWDVLCRWLLWMNSFLHGLFRRGLSPDDPMDNGLHFSGVVMSARFFL